MASEKRLLKILLFISEIFAVAALASTGDILRPVLVISFTGLLFLNLLESRLYRHRFTTGFLIALLVPVTYVVHKIYGFRPLEDAAQLVLMLHLTIFFLPDADRARQFRFGITFAITSLAASLSPELATGVLIVLYFASAFVMLLMQFVLEFSANRFKDLARFGRGKSWMYVTLGVVVFLATSAVIFPLLPRLNVNRFIKTNSLGQLGFSGEVDLQTKADPTQFTSVALRIEVPDNEETKALLEGQELLKARNLDSFDGRSWYSSPSRFFSDQELAPVSNAHPITLQREAIEVPSLPIFYGSQILSVAHTDFQHRLQRSIGNNYRVTGTSKARVTYQISLPAKDAKSTEAVEAPIISNQNSHLENPDFSHLIEAYSKKIFAGSTLDTQRAITALDRFFKKEGYTYSLDPLSETAANGYERFRKFLVDDKQGHCELYATAAALLLRAKGIPTRLAAGFRMPAVHGNRFIVLKNSDAHVWVEAWDSQARQWVVYDPTPSEVIPVWKRAFEEAVGMRDDVEAYWYRYVVDSEDIDTAKLFKGLFGTVFAHHWMWGVLGLFLIFLGFQGRGYYRQRILAHYGILPRPEILRLARSIRRLERQHPQCSELAQHRRRYQELRFAKIDEDLFREKFRDALENVKQSSNF